LTPEIEVGVTATQHTSMPWPEPGGALSLGLAIRPLRAVALAGLRYGQAMGDRPAVRFWTFDLAYAARIGPWSGSWRLDFRAAAVLQQVRASAVEPTTGLNDVASTNRFGMRLSVAPALRFAPSMYAVAAFEGSVLRPELFVDVEDVEALALPATTFGAFIGVRVEL
jgi:hypothetical protein